MVKRCCWWSDDSPHRPEWDARRVAPSCGRLCGCDPIALMDQLTDTENTWACGSKQAGKAPLQKRFLRYHYFERVPSFLYNLLMACRYQESRSKVLTRIEIGSIELGDHSKHVPYIKNT